MINCSSASKDERTLGVTVRLIGRRPRTRLLVARIFRRAVRGIPVDGRGTVRPMEAGNCLLRKVRVPPLPMCRSRSSTAARTEIGRDISGAFFGTERVLRPCGVGMGFSIVRKDPTSDVSRCTTTRGTSLVVINDSNGNKVGGVFLKDADSGVTGGTPYPILVTGSGRGPRVP